MSGAAVVAKLRNFIPAGIFLAAFLAFLPSLQGTWLNWDDTVNFLNNPHYRGLGLSQLRWMWTNVMGHYMPLTWMTLGLDYELWGMRPAGYRLTNLLIHAANATLAFVFLRALLRRAKPPPASEGLLDGAAAAAALLYALHPQRAESVAWVTERRDLVAGFFVLLSLLAYVRAVTPEIGRPRFWLALSIVAFAASLLSKAIAMTLPLALLALDAWPLGRWSRGKDGRIPWRPLIAEKIPFALLGVFAVVITAIGQSEANAWNTDDSLHRLHDALALPAYKLGFYFVKTFVPLGLSPLYAYRPPIRVFEPVHVVAAAAVLAGAVVLFRVRGRIPELAFGALTFTLLLGPVVGPIQAGPHFAADRYTYVAHLAWAIAAGALLLRLPDRARPAGAALAGILILGFGAASFRQSRVWRDSETLWDRAIEIDDTAYLPYLNRGAYRLSIGRYPEAVEDFTRSHELDPLRGKAQANRAQAYLAMGRIQDAVRDASEAVASTPHQSRPWFVRGEVNSALGRLPEAVADYTAALQLDPKLLEGYLARALARGRMGDARGAFEDADAAIALFPHHPEPWINRAVARGELGDFDGAGQDYSRAIDLKADIPEAWAGRGKIKLLRGDLRGSLLDFDRALRLAPPDWPHRRAVESDRAEAQRRSAGP